MSQPAGIDERSQRLTALKLEVAEVEHVMEALRERLRASAGEASPESVDAVTPGARRNGLEPRPARPRRWHPSVTAVLACGIALAAAAAYVLAGPTLATPGTGGIHVRAFDVLAVVLLVVDTYLIVLAGVGRGPAGTRTKPSTGRPSFVLAIAAADEPERVETSVQRLLELDCDRFVVLVIDHGDGRVTDAAIRAARGDRRVLAQRVAADRPASALNAAFRRAREMVEREDSRLDRASAAGTIFGVLQAGSWLRKDALQVLGRQFDRQHVAAAQVRVRVSGARETTMAALEDLETNAFHVIGQAARDRSGTAHLTRNGAFFRLATLDRLSSSPWSGRNDDELDIWLGLIGGGYRIRSCRATCLYEPSAGSLRTLSAQRWDWARSRRAAWAVLPRLWDTGRISISARVSLSLQLLAALPLLIPAVAFAFVGAIALAFLPAEGGWIASVVHGGIAARAVVVGLAAAPLAALCVSYMSSVYGRDAALEHADGAERIAPAALPGLAVTLMASAALRAVPVSGSASRRRGRDVGSSPRTVVSTDRAPAAAPSGIRA